MTVAPIDRLSALHAALANTMSDALDAEVARMNVTRELLEIDLSDIDEETAKSISAILTLAPTARVDNALLKTIASFLKDNNITADLAADDAEDETAAAIAKLQEKRKRVALPTDFVN